MSLDFNQLMSLKLPTDGMEKDMNNGFDGIRNFVLEGRYLYYDTYYQESLEEAKKRIVYVYDMHFNTLYTSFELNTLGLKISQGLRIRKLRFLPYNLTDGLIFNNRTLQRIEINPERRETKNLGEAYNSPVVHLDIKFMGEYLMILGYSDEEDANFIYLFKWPYIQNIVAKVRLNMSSPRWNSVRTYMSRLDSQPNTFAFVYLQDIAPETNEYKYEPSVYLWDIEETENEFALMKIETTGTKDWPKGRNLFLRGEWRSHLFFCTMHNSLEYFHKKQTHFYVFNLTTKIWSEFAKKYYGMISLAPTIENDSNEPLILCSYAFKDTELVVDEMDEEKLPFISNFYRLQIRQPEQLETLCRCATIRFGILDNIEAEDLLDDSSENSENLPEIKEISDDESDEEKPIIEEIKEISDDESDEEKPIIEEIVIKSKNNSLKRRSSPILPDHLKPKIYKFK